MRNIEIEGCSRVQELLVLSKLSYETVPSGHILIKFHQDIELGKGDSLWYGGKVASIYYNGYEFIITADGEVDIRLYYKDNDELVADVIDKSMQGKFKQEMSEYIKNDTHLYEIYQDEDNEYSIDVSNSNWYELSCTDRNKQWHDLECALDESDIYASIAMSIDQLQDFIEFLEEETNE